MNFRKFRKFSEDNYNYDKNAFYDHDFILNGKLPNAILKSENDDMSLEITTSNPILHIYTGPLDRSFNTLGTAIECEKKAYDMNDIFLKKNTKNIQYSRYQFKLN
jgi:galactose mutarotase-like enzyme